jgi:hypothetical protein
MKCIIKYKDQENECFCNKLKECSKCNNKNNRESEEKCEVSPNGYCTCRTCGHSVRA